ncbi:MAG: hypothetical protein IT162_07400 [Bryobacterales bacterium]|nr:hypothetical protein [Bryobacterales bacterium]
MLKTIRSCSTTLLLCCWALLVVNTVNSATIDFSSIHDGTIDGVFRFTITSGWMEFTGPVGFSLQPLRAAGPGSLLGD